MTGTLGFNGRYFDHFTIAVHMLLSTSSLLFHVLSARILSRPMIIWEEYRLHAIVFSLRCFSLYLFAVFRPFQDQEYESVIQGVLGLLHHVVADKISERYGASDKSSTTVRLKDDHGLLTTIVFRFYAFYQFSALASHLNPNKNLEDMAFNALIAIQSSAFLMTLYRKSFISYKAHAFWYTFCLIISIYHIMRSCAMNNSLFILKLSLTYLIRVKFGVSKYILWSLFIICTIPTMESHLKQEYQLYTSRVIDDDVGYIIALMVAVGVVLFTFERVKNWLYNNQIELYNLLRQEFSKMFPVLYTYKQERQETPQKENGIKKNI